MVDPGSSRIQVDLTHFSKETLTKAVARIAPSQYKKKIVKDT